MKVAMKRVSDKRLRALEYVQHSHYLYGLSAQKNGDDRSAFAQYRSEIRKTGYYKAYLMLGHMLLDRGRSSEARDAFEFAARGARRLGRHDHAAAALTSLGVALEESNNVVGAKAVWRRAARLDPRNCSALVNLGLRLLLDGDRRKGQFALEEALRRRPRDSQTRRWVGYGLVRFDIDVRRGLRYLEGAACAEPAADPRLLADLHTAYEKLKSPSDRKMLRRDSRRASEVK